MMSNHHALIVTPFVGHGSRVHSLPYAGSSVACEFALSHYYLRGITIHRLSNNNIVCPCCSATQANGSEERHDAVWLW